MLSPIPTPRCPTSISIGYDASIGSGRHGWNDSRLRGPILTRLLRRLIRRVNNHGIDFTRSLHLILASIVCVVGGRLRRGHRLLTQRVHELIHGVETFPVDRVVRLELKEELVARRYKWRWLSGSAKPANLLGKFLAAIIHFNVVIPAMGRKV